LKTTIVEQINTKQRAFELIKDSSDGLYVLKNCNWQLNRQPLNPKSSAKPLLTLNNHPRLSKTTERINYPEQQHRTSTQKEKALSLQDKKPMHELNLLEASQQHRKRDK
jgi:hypothetical protein